MEERTKKEIAERFIKFCDRFMNLYIKNYEHFLTAEIKDSDSIIRCYKTETTIYKFTYERYWGIIYSDKVYLIEKNELINGHKFYEYKRGKGKSLVSDYTAGKKTWEEKYKEIIKE